MSAAFFPSGGQSDPLAGNSNVFLMEAAVYGALAVLCLIHWRTIFPTLLRSWPLALLLLFALCSACWSSDALVTIKRAAIMFATSLFGVYFGSRFEREQQIRILALGLVVMALLSVALAVAFPGRGLESEMHAGAWRGIFPQKNMLGRMMVLGCCSLLCVSPGTLTGKALRLGGIALCGGLILLSRSRDAILIGAVVWSCSLIAMKFKNSIVLACLFSGIAAAAAAFILFPSGVESLLVALGRDATLTGRTDIWRACVDAISDKPLFGYGFSAFWRGLNGPSISIIAAADWMVPHSHDGYLDLILELGFAGLGLFAFSLFEHVRRAAKEFRMRPTRLNWWPLLYITLLLLYDIGESSILHPNSIFWAIYVAAIASLLRSDAFHNQPSGQMVRIEIVERGAVLSTT